MGWFRLLAHGGCRGMLNTKEGSAVKYMVGLKNADQNLLECICQNKAHIHEVYFSWGDFPNGRSSQLLSDRYAPWELDR